MKPTTVPPHPFVVQCRVGVCLEKKKLFLYCRFRRGDLGRGRTSAPAQKAYGWQCTCFFSRYRCELTSFAISCDAQPHCRSLVVSSVGSNSQNSKLQARFKVRSIARPLAQAPISIHIVSIRTINHALRPYGIFKALSVFNAGVLVCHSISLPKYVLVQAAAVLTVMYGVQARKFDEFLSSLNKWSACSHLNH